MEAPRSSTLLSVESLSIGFTTASQSIQVVHDVTFSIGHGERLALVTCYPFDGMFHSPLRYVVIADRVADVTPPAAASSGTR